MLQIPIIRIRIRPPKFAKGTTSRDFRHLLYLFHFINEQKRVNTIVNVAKIFAKFAWTFVKFVCPRSRWLRSQTVSAVVDYKDSGHGQLGEFCDLVCVDLQQGHGAVLPERQLNEEKQQLLFGWHFSSVRDFLMITVKD